MNAVVDLSHPCYEGMPLATTIPAPSFRPVRTMEEHGLRCLELTLPIHLGTHLDAPSHFVADGDTVDEVPLSTLVGPALCVEVDRGTDEPIEVADLEPLCGAAQPGDALLIRTGWDARFTDPGYLHHPYLSVPAAEWIVRRGFRLVGVDTVTPGDLRPEPYPCPVHTTLLGHGVLILENLVLLQVVDRRLTLVIGALRIVGGDGSPARVPALPLQDTPMEGDT